MPELPEVETTRRGIAPHIEGETIHQLIIRQNKLRWPIPEELPGLICNQALRAVQRRAKYLLFQFDHGCMLIHLGMSGSLHLIQADSPITKHAHADFIFANGITLRYTDPRRFGAILWLGIQAEQHPLIAKLGPEPLAHSFNAKHLFTRSRNKKVAIKTFIMDQTNVTGVGNIYANEALFIAGIRPATPAGRISKNRYEKLAAAIKVTLQQAIEQGGTTLRDFVGGDGKPGYFQQQLHVYGRGNLPCLSCGNILTEIRLTGRSSVYCRHCQH